MKRSVTELLDPEIVAEVDSEFPDVPTIGMPLTETGNAERMVARFRNRIRYCTPRRKWLIWDGRRWAWDDRGRIQQIAKRTVRAIYSEAEHARDEDSRKAIVKHACASEKGSARKQMIELAQSEKGIPVLPSELDADPWLLTVENGTIDLRTGDIRPHNPVDMITKIAPVTYDKEARSSLWEKYLKDATGGDDELGAYLQRSVGYALQGSVTEKAFWFLYGKPDGMKSTFIESVSAALGDHAATADFTSWLVQTNTGGNRGDLVSLLGARLVTSVEVRKGAKFDEAIIKKITGGDELKAAAKFESEITFRPTFALWLAANDAPVIRDDDEGAWSRVRRVPFDNPLPPEQRDPTMREKLRAPEVQSAIVAWAVQGCLDWQEQGIGTCAAVERSSAAYRGEMDRVAGFFDERCLFGPMERVVNSELRGAYEEWCKEQGIRHPLSGKEFAARLKDRLCEACKVQGKRGWRGLRLLEPGEEPEPHRTPGQQGTANPYSPYEEKSHYERSGTADPCCPDVPDEEREAIQNEGASPEEDAPGFEWMSPEGE